MEKRTAKAKSPMLCQQAVRKTRRDYQNNHIMNSELSPNLLSIIVLCINGRPIAYPTEAVFGLGYDPDSEQAVNALLARETAAVGKRADFDRRRLCTAVYIDDSALSEQQRTTMLQLAWAAAQVLPARPETPRC